MNMTPLHIRMMLHYYAIATPYAEHDPFHASSIAVAEYRGHLIQSGLIEEDLKSPSGYRSTARGRAYVEALCDMPLPIQKWVMPSAAA